MAAKIRRRKKKICFFCSNAIMPHYRHEPVLRRFVTERGKIVPRRMTGVCAKHQRKLALAVKRARHIAFFPFVSENIS